MKSKIIFVTLIAFVFGGILLLKIFSKAENNNGGATENQKILEPQKNSEGAVEVIVAPKNISDEIWEFEIVMDTHLIDLNYDLMELAELVDDKSQIHKPSSWIKDAIGGHHISGILAFEPINPLPLSIEIVLKEIGGVNTRKFKWELKQKTPPS